MAWTTLELAEASEAKGMAKGIAQGIAQGKAEGKAEVLLKLLRFKFGRLPAQTEATVKAASPAQLDAWADAILTATTLNEALAAKP